MTSHFLAQDLKHINSKLTYQCDVTHISDFLIIHPFSLMVNQTSEFQVLGSGSTFKRSFVSLFTSSHPRTTLLEPAESSSRPHILLLPQSCHVDFLRSATAGLWRRVAGWLVCDVRRIVVAREWPTILRNVEKHSLSDTASYPRRLESSATTTLEFLIAQHLVSSPLVVAREYIWRRVQIMQLLLRHWAACSPKRPLDNTGCPQKSFNRIPNC